jgi:hypothetical protein
LQVDRGVRLKELPPYTKTCLSAPRLEQENVKLKRLVAELSLDKLVLKDIASGSFLSLSDGLPPHGRRPIRGTPTQCGRSCQWAGHEGTTGMPTGESATRHAALPADTARRRRSTNSSHHFVGPPIWGLWLPAHHSAVEASGLESWLGSG